MWGFKSPFEHAKVGNLPRSRGLLKLQVGGELNMLHSGRGQLALAEVEVLGWAPVHVGQGDAVLEERVPPGGVVHAAGEFNFALAVLGSAPRWGLRQAAGERITVRVAGPIRRVPSSSGAQRTPPRPRRPRNAPGASTTSIQAQGWAGR